MVSGKAGAREVLAPVLFATLVTAIGGFLFGYDTAVISGAVGFMKAHFQLHASQEGLVGASATIGCIPGAMFAGVLADRLGRKKVLYFCAALFALSGIASGLSQSFALFIVTRLAGGLAIGAASMVCPVYIAEIAPERHRGRLGALFQLGVVTGILLVFFVNLWIQRQGSPAWNEAWGWRWMLGSEALPALLFFLLLFTVPESPRWLAVNGQETQARVIFERLAGAEAAERELAAVQAVSSREEGRIGELFSRAYRKPLIIAVGLAALSQFSGINAVMYYAPEIFKQTGGGTDQAFASSVWVGVINLAFTFVAIAFVDKAGRKPLLAIGTAVQVVSLVAVGWMFHQGGQGLGVLLGILAFVAAFAMAMGPIPWILISEVFPARIRGRAAAVGTFTVWAGCFVVAETFPVLKEKVGAANTFWTYALFSLASLLFVLFYLPETKGRTLEEIEEGWKSRESRV